MDILPYTMFLVALSIALFEEDTLRFIPLSIMVVYPKHFRTVFCTAVFMLFFDDSDAAATHGVAVIAILVAWWLISKAFIKDIHLFFRMDLRSEQVGLGGFWSEQHDLELAPDSKFSVMFSRAKNLLFMIYSYLEKVLVAIMAVYHAWSFKDPQTKQQYTWIQTYTLNIYLYCLWIKVANLLIQELRRGGVRDKRVKVY